MAVTPTPTATAACANHRRKGAVGRCASCSVPLCRDCMVDTRVGFKCASCGGGAPAPSRSRPGWARPAAVAAAVALVAVLAVVVLGGGDEDTGPIQASVDESTPSERAVERRVQFDGAGDLTISGTVTVPAGASAEAPVAGVVIIPGFGPTTREGVAPPGSVVDPLYRDLSALLVDEGVATLRYDKRGTGDSVLPADQELTFDDMAGDAGAAVAFLAERAEVDPERISVIGHEEGGLVGLRLAAANPEVARLALVSVPGRPLLEVLVDDFNNSGHGDQVEALRSVATALVAGGPLPAPADIPPFVRDFFPGNQQSYLRDIFSVDPVALAAEVDVPVLIVRGGSSTGISSADADALAAALGPDTEVVVADSAGPTLQVIEAPRGGADPSDPVSASHEHGAGPPVQASGRSQPALASIAEFVVAS